jgi:hypothetical protein
MIFSAVELVAGGNLGNKHKVIAIPKTLINWGRGRIAVSVYIAVYCEVEKRENYRG